MGTMGFTPETASKAGKLSKGRSKKDMAWMHLGTHMTTKYARNIRSYMDRLWKEGREDEAIELYLKLLQYFKPKVVAHAVKTETEITFKFEGVSKDLIEKI